MAITSANQEALMSESVQIDEGRPAVYQLIPKKEMIGTLTRVMVGEKDEKKINKTILLVGETGTGKSTLINALFNYDVGVKFEDEIWFQIVDEEEKSQTESQTSDVIVYQIFGYEGQTLPFSLTIIDTPGYGDTRGKEHDGKVSLRLLDLFGSEDGVHEIDAVGLVMKASDNRLTDRTMYVFDSVMSLFGKDLETNIVALITHSDGTKPENVLLALEDAKIKCSRDEKNQPIYFMFNNQQKKQRNTTEKENLGSKTFWDFTNAGIDCLRDFLKETEPHPLKTTVEVLNERIRLKACIQNLKERISLTEKKQREIKQIKEAVNKHDKEMKECYKYSIEVDEVYIEKEPMDGGMWWKMFYDGAVTCSVCEENCHVGCSMAWKPEYCWVMKGGHCTVCTKKCPASVHVKDNWIYVTKTKRVQKTLEDVKEKYEKNRAECETKLSYLEKLEKETNKLTAERSSLLGQAYRSVIRLGIITLKVDSRSTLVHLDFLIEKMREEGDQEKVKKLEQMKIRLDEVKEGETQWQKGWKIVKRAMSEIDFIYE